MTVALVNDYQKDEFIQKTLILTIENQSQYHFKILKINSSATP